MTFLAAAYFVQGGSVLCRLDQPSDVGGCCKYARDPRSIYRLDSPNGKDAVELSDTDVVKPL